MPLAYSKFAIFKLFRTYLQTCLAYSHETLQECWSAYVVKHLSLFSIHVVLAWLLPLTYSTRHAKPAYFAVLRRTRSRYTARIFIAKVNPYRKHPRHIAANCPPRDFADIRHDMPRKLTGNYITGLGDTHVWLCIQCTFCICLFAYNICATSVLYTFYLHTLLFILILNPFIYGFI